MATKDEAVIRITAREAALIGHLREVPIAPGATLQNAMQIMKLRMEVDTLIDKAQAPFKAEGEAPKAEPEPAGETPAPAPEKSKRKRH